MKTINTLIALVVSLVTGLFFVAVFIIAAVWIIEKICSLRGIDTTTPDGVKKALHMVDVGQAAIVLIVLGCLVFGACSMMADSHADGHMKWLMVVCMIAGCMALVGKLGGPTQDGKLDVDSTQDVRKVYTLEDYKLTTAIPSADNVAQAAAAGVIGFVIVVFVTVALATM